MSKRLKLDEPVEMEDSIAEQLQNINYPGGLSSAILLKNVVSAKILPPTFIELVVWLTKELKELWHFEETVSSDPDTFVIDIKGFLREMGCPYNEVMDSKHLETSISRLLLLDYLVTEVQAGRMYAYNKKVDAEEKAALSSPLHSLANLLEVPLDSENLFSDIQIKLESMISMRGEDFLGKPLLTKKLTKEQWKEVEDMNTVLNEEYRLRCEVLLKRFDVTMQSFAWKDKMNDHSKGMEDSIQSLHSSLESMPSIVDLLAARTDLLEIEPTSTGLAREQTKCVLNKHLMGQVPDRGGRPSSVPPPSEMPRFQQRQAGAPPQQHRGGGYRGRDNKRGNRGGNRGGGGWRGRGRGDYTRDSRSQNEEKLYYS